MNIQEDYVSFETAKLLKEKGFDWYTYAYYEDENNPNISLRASKAINWNKTEFISKPTLQMAIKWLREDKKILISIFCHINRGYWVCIQHFIKSPYKFATSESIHRKEEILGKIQYYDTYEQACENAIKYCLENLI